MMTYVLVVVFAGIYVYREYLWHNEREANRVERQKLIDRIQSNSLAEYKALEVPVRPREPREQKERLEQI